MVALSAALIVSCAGEKKGFPDTALDYCTAQTLRTLGELTPADYSMSPRNIAPGGERWSLREAVKEEWTSGFWPGVLWYGYEYSGNSTILEAAEGYTSHLGFLADIPAHDHDLGFLVYCSYGNGYRLTGREDYKDVIVGTAHRLAGLYNPAVGTILSWPREVNMFGGHNTIMDNMMNLELLFAAAEMSGDGSLYDIAVAHADTTMKYGFQADGTSYHVAVYNPENGEFIGGRTHQGYADQSMWARGQAWAIYGYTMCYRFTGEKRYLDFARKVTDVYLARLPEDMIPYWDFNDPAIPDTSRDASAAAVVASALLELSCLTEEGGSRYRTAAEKMLTELDAHYRGGEANPAFLVHSTGHRPAGSEIDYAIIYADYYYIEALMRLKRLAAGEPVLG